MQLEEHSAQCVWDDFSIKIPGGLDLLQGMQAHVRYNMPEAHKDWLRLRRLERQQLPPLKTFSIRGGVQRLLPVTEGMLGHDSLVLLPVLVVAICILAVSIKI